MERSIDGKHQQNLQGLLHTTSEFQINGLLLHLAESFSLLARVKGLRRPDTVFLNDGVYGGLADLRDMTLPDRVRVFCPAGSGRRGTPRPRVIFGPTCDSLDRLPDGLPLPDDTAVGDYVLFDAMGAYSIAMSTAFNGYGLRDVTSVQSLR